MGKPAEESGTIAHGDPARVSKEPATRSGRDNTPAARALPDELANLDIRKMPGHLIRRLHQISVSVFSEELKAAGHDLTQIQFASLSALSSPKWQNTTKDQATLAAIIGHDRATIGSVVDRLERKGFVTRTVSKSDRRARELDITESGISELVKVVPLIEEMQTRILFGLDSEESAELVRLLQKTVKAGNERSRAPIRSI